MKENKPGNRKTEKNAFSGGKKGIQTFSDLNFYDLYVKLGNKGCNERHFVMG